jgi:hypothetical protein
VRRLTIFSLLSDKNRTLFSLSFCLDTKERKNQVADYSLIHSTLEIRPFQRSLRATSRFPYFNSLCFIRIIGDRRKKTNLFFKMKARIKSLFLIKIPTMKLFVFLSSFIGTIQNICLYHGGKASNPKRT